MLSTAVLPGDVDFQNLLFERYMTCGTPSHRNNEEGTRGEIANFPANSIQRPAGKSAYSRDGPLLVPHDAANSLTMLASLNSPRRGQWNESSPVTVDEFVQQAWSENTSGGTPRGVGSLNLFPSGLRRSRHGRERKSRRGSRAGSYIWISLPLLLQKFHAIQQDRMAD
jgi:hypothetical protein